MTEKDRHMSEEDDLDLDRIVHNAVASANLDVPRSEVSIRMRLALLLAALVVIGNSVIGIYNSIIVRQEVECNHELNNALQVVGDQSRVSTKQVIDTLLSGKPITESEVLKVRQQYDAAYAKNTQQRQRLLATTCSDGSAPTSGVVSP